MRPINTTSGYQHPSELVNVVREGDRRADDENQRPEESSIVVPQEPIERVKDDRDANQRQRRCQQDGEDRDGPRP